MFIHLQIAVCNPSLQVTVGIRRMEGDKCNPTSFNQRWFTLTNQYSWTLFYPTNENHNKNYVWTGI